ncbi:MAG TPA: aminotransferase class IV [Phycisphaerae bacterium]|jgi:D-alanine transaminase
MPELAYVNGVFGPIGEACVSIEDRGFQFADGVYEVIVAYAGRLFRLERHLARLQRSCDALQIKYEVVASGIGDMIREGLRRSDIPEAMVYVQVTRGAGPRSHLYADGLRPTVVATVRPRPVLPPQVRQSGVGIKITTDPRWAHCDIKSIALLPNVLAKNEAVRAGFDDALFIGSDGEVREATTANFFMVQDGQLVTPPLSNRILHGVTRAYILECARAIDIPAHERRIERQELDHASEIFLSNTTSEIIPVTRVEHAAVGNGQCGPITQRLHARFQAGIKLELS